jgi:cobalt-zinc-cadmium efflux system outer membrane protein
MALERNQSLRAQRLAIDQAKALEITAATKPNPVFSNLNEDFPIFSPSDLTLQNLRTNQEFTDSVTYTIERGGKRLDRIVVARDNTDMTVKTIADSERQLRFQVAQAFITVLLARSNFAFAKADLKDFAQVVEINQRRMNAGDISEADYLKIALQQLQFQQDVSATEVALVQGKAVLRQLVGYNSVPENFDVSGDLKHTHFTITPDELDKEAVLSRPDYLAAQSAVKLANDTVKLAYGNRVRDLTVESEYKRSGLINGVGFGLSRFPFMTATRVRLRAARLQSSRQARPPRQCSLGLRLMSPAALPVTRPAMRWHLSTSPDTSIRPHSPGKSAITRTREARRACWICSTPNGAIERPSWRTDRRWPRS